MKKILLILVAAVFSLNIYAQPKFEKLYQGSEAVTSLDNDYFAVKRNGKWGVMKGRIQILDFYYDSIDVLSDGVITFIRNNQAGFADTSGNIISLADYSLETPYNRADESALNIFQSGSALVYDGTKLILLGKDGKQINDDQTEVVSKADNCVIFKKKAAYGLMDAKGRVLAENKYRRIQTVVAGELYAYTASKDGMDYLGLIDAQGNVKSAAQYEDLTVINKGDRFYVKAFVSSGKQALYSSCGDLLIQPLYQNTEPTDNADYYIFTENSRKGLLNSEYIKLIPAEYDNVSVYDKDGNIFFIARNEDMTYIFGKDGKLRDAVSGNIKDFVSFNNDELLYVADSMLNYGIRSDKRGWVVNPQYLDVFAQAGDNLVVRQKDKWGAVDYSGNVNVEFEYKKVRASKSNSCVVFYEGKNNSVILTHDAKSISHKREN